MSSFSFWQADPICGVEDRAWLPVTVSVEVAWWGGAAQTGPCHFRCAGRDHDPQPGAPIRHLGLLAEGLARSWTQQAGRAGLELERLQVIVTATIDPGGRAGIEPYPRDIDFEVVISASAVREQVLALQAAAERGCPILNMLRGPQPIAGAFTLLRSQRATLFDAPAAARYEAVHFTG